MSAYRLGIDIGGTFTDGALVDETTGEILIVKVSTTPVDPATGFMTAVERALHAPGAPATQYASSCMPLLSPPMR
jgi:N-methylhydantoinase A